jgi:putative oxidoreductase
MAQAFLAGRIVVGVYYLWSAFKHFANMAGMAKYVAAQGIPMPEAAVIVSGILLAIAGVTLLLGIYPHIGVAALVFFFIPVTLAMHAFWADTDPAARQANLLNFTKNAALLGSSLMFLAVPRPWPYSVERRARLPIPATA